jgi:NAD-dependent dihydropyrimidine dehydrogenase PreA subunit
MAIERIDTEKCNGCGVCADTCSQDVIRMDLKAKRAVVSYPEDCTTCAICELECPRQAIFVSPTRVGAPVGSW